MCSVLPWKCNNGFPVHCFRDTKHFVLLPKIWTYLRLRGKYFCPILTDFHISRQLNAEVLNTKFHANPYSGSCSDISGQTAGQNDRHDIANGRFSRLMWMRPKAYTDKWTRTDTLDCGNNTSLLPDIQALCSLHFIFLSFLITRLGKSY
jgi:hypothetical protein